MGKSVSITDFNSLQRFFSLQKQNRDNAKSELRLIHALDTETRDGNIFLIADSDGKFLDNITPENIINFLFSAKYQNTWNFFFNLNYDAEVILKLLGTELYKYKQTHNLNFTFKNYKIRYIPSKSLSITKGHHSTVFFDIAQFYKESLLSAYENNIGKIDDNYKEIKKQRAVFSKSFYKDNKNKVRNYCIQDCKYTKELSEHFVNLFNNAFDFMPKRWLSSGYLAEKVIINHGIKFPYFNETPFKIQQFAKWSYFGGRFEILKRGHIGTAYLYDINSAYPFAMTKIPDLLDGKWINSKTINQNAEIGFFKIHADIPDFEMIPCFPFRKNNMIIFPSGKFDTFCTLSELKVCDPKFYKVIDAWQFIPNKETLGDIKYPFKKFIEKLYRKRMRLKRQNDPMQLPIKIILNSMYGKTGQVYRNRIGNLYNPVIFSFITGTARAMLYNFAKENKLENELVSFATDSICTTRKINLKSAKLGEFSHENEANDVFFLQNGIYRFNGKWKQRGLGRLGTKAIEHLDTFEKDSKLFIKIKILRSNRLRQSILSNNLKDIGKITEKTREINLNTDKKRFWLETLTGINDKINESLPLSLNFFTKEQI